MIEYINNQPTLVDDDNPSDSIVSGSSDVNNALPHLSPDLPSTIWSSNHTASINL